MSKHPEADRFRRAAVTVLEEFAMRYGFSLLPAPRFLSGEPWHRNAGGKAGNRHVCFQVLGLDPVGAPEQAIVTVWVNLAPAFPERQGWFQYQAYTATGLAQIGSTLEVLRTDLAEILELLGSYHPGGNRTRQS